MRASTRQCDGSRSRRRDGLAVVARAGARVVARDLWRFCETRLPYFAVPRYLDVVAELPRTETGKVQKFKLRERGVTVTAFDRTRPLTPGVRA